MFKEKIQSILKNICGALVLPVLMYVVMMIFCFQNGKMYYGSVAMWRSLISTIALQQHVLMVLEFNLSLDVWIFQQDR